MNFVCRMRKSNLIQRWVEQGEVEGDPADLPATPKFVEGWRLGKPDLVLTATKPLTLPPSGHRHILEFYFSGPDSRNTLGESG